MKKTEVDRAERESTSEEIFLGSDRPSHLRKQEAEEWSSGQTVRRSSEGAYQELARESAGLELGDLIDGKYEVERLIGEGGMGKVYEVHHRLIKRRGALKCLHPHRASDPEMVARFVHEAQAAAAIGSEHIIDVTDAGVTPGGIPYLVMEYLDGRDLGQELRDLGVMEVERAAKLMLQVCRALSAAHDQGIVHRDLKPENILLITRRDGSEVIKVLDFGMAKFHDMRITSAGDTLGSPFFMAPEQFGGSADIDHRADIYAVGVILYELVTGELPFKGPSMGELVYQVMMTDVVPPRELNPEVSESFEQVILTAMHRERDQRFQKMDELSNELDSFLELLPRKSLPPSPRMIKVPAGHFVMGSPEDEPGRFDDEVQHEVGISRPFLLAVRPVTQAEWKALMAFNPSHFIGPDHPVEMVSWFDAVVFCNALSEVWGMEPAYELTDIVGRPYTAEFTATVTWVEPSGPGYRLPTEAEWEHACRGGLKAGERDEEELELIGWYSGNSAGGTHPVGQKRPNSLGLHDMLGNVWEWCWDWYESYEKGKVVDPRGPNSAFGRVDRGGGWDSDALLCRPADRDGFLPMSRSKNLGFRIARTFVEDDD